MLIQAWHKCYRNSTPILILSRIFEKRFGWVLVCFHWLRANLYILNLAQKPYKIWYVFKDKIETGNLSKILLILGYTISLNAKARKGNGKCLKTWYQSRLGPL